jgi:hypothetical protein
MSLPVNGGEKMHRRGGAKMHFLSAAYTEPSCWPWVGLSEPSISRMMQSGGVRSCTRSIQAPANPSAPPGWRRSPALGLEAPDLAAGGGQALLPLAINDRPHRGITGKPLGVVDVLVAGEQAEDRFAEQPAKEGGLARASAGAETRQGSVSAGATLSALTI